MNYNFTYGRNAPGLIYILCDLSQKMARVKNILEETVRKTLVDYINCCICGCQVADRIHITLIGYGNKAPFLDYMKIIFIIMILNILVFFCRNDHFIIVDECIENQFTYLNQINQQHIKSQNN